MWGNAESGELGVADASLGKEEEKQASEWLWAVAELSWRLGVSRARRSCKAT